MKHISCILALQKFATCVIEYQEDHFCEEKIYTLPDFSSVRIVNTKNDEINEVNCIHMDFSMYMLQLQLRFDLDSCK